MVVIRTWLVLSVVFSLVLCDRPGVDVAENIIASYNRFFRDNNMTEADLNEMFISPIMFSKGRIRDLDTLELLPNPVIASRPDHDGVTYDYSLKIALKKMTVQYQFEVFLPLIHTKGTFSMEFGNNSFHADGHVFVGNDGNCSAILNDAYVSKLSDYHVKINPKDIWIPFVRRFYEGRLDKIVHEEFPTLLSLNILGQKMTPDFKERFSNIVCSEIKRNGIKETAYAGDD